MEALVEQDLVEQVVLDIYEKHMTCYKCTTSNNASDRTRTTDNVSEDAESDYAKKGNGYAKITLIMVSQ